MFHFLPSLFTCKDHNKSTSYKLTNYSVFTTTTHLLPNRLNRIPLSLHSSSFPSLPFPSPTLPCNRCGVYQFLSYQNKYILLLIHCNADAIIPNFRQSNASPAKCPPPFPRHWSEISRPSVERSHLPSNNRSSKQTSSYRSNQSACQLQFSPVSSCLYSCTRTSEYSRDNGSVHINLSLFLLVRDHSRMRHRPHEQSIVAYPKNFEFPHIPQCHLQPFFPSMMQHVTSHPP